jgi:hypothetical protein
VKVKFIKSVALVTAVFSSVSIHAGDFDWGSQCSSGSDSKTDSIPHRASKVIGDIPANKSNVYIQLDAGAVDVDIQLIDQTNGTEIIAWPNGVLGSSGSEACASYQGLEYCYSGYEGVNGQSGVEWISIQGVTNRTLTMKAFGYEAGDAVINYSWDAIEGCGDYDVGNGTFSQNIPYREDPATEIGVIPAGKAQVKVNLNSAVDVDVQLFDGSTPIIQWPNGLLNGASKESVEYKGMKITYSGYNGDGTGYGNEYIQISGITSADLTMRAYGYQAGVANVEYEWGLDSSKGAIAIPTRTVFEDLSSRSDVPGAMGIREIKFLIKGINSDYPSLYFINTNNIEYHIDFAYHVLNWYPGISYNEANRQFNTSSYFFDGRENLAGSILAHDSYQAENSTEQGIYTMQMWPTDPVTPQLIEKAYKLISQNMAIAENKLAYYPSSDTQTTIYQDNIDFFSSHQVQVIENEALFANVTYTALNLGEGYGTLRVVNEGDPTPSVNDVVLFTYIPNDLTHVAGIITDSPQTPLSHINLKAKQNNTPNAFIKNAAHLPEVAALLGQLVHYKVTADGFILESATQTQVDTWLESVRPASTQTPISDLSITQPAQLSTLGHQDWVSFGAKAANVAELAKVLDPGTYPEGYAIPFAMYDEFMKLNRCQGFEDDGITLDGHYRDLCADANDPAGKSYYQQIQEIMSQADFINSPDVRDIQLNAFRKEIKKGQVPTDMSVTLESIRYFWDADGTFTHSIRLRSSTNNEDLEGFNGAGLYDSNTHDPDEGDIAESVKKVWASLWTTRAFEERRFYRIDHFKTYMGVLAHLSYGDEQVNGVAVTKNIYDKNWEGYYVNAQYGEISVTNPEPIVTSAGTVSSIPDEFLLANLLVTGSEYDWVQQYIRHSNVETVYDLPVMTENVLTDAEVTELRIAMQKIQAHFKGIYAGDANFAMDIEFKITHTEDGSRGHLEIKQARPWVD